MKLKLAIVVPVASLAIGVIVTALSHPAVPHDSPAAYFGAMAGVCVGHTVFAAIPILVLGLIWNAVAPGGVMPQRD